MKQYIVFLFSWFFMQSFCYSQNDVTKILLPDIEKIADSTAFNNALKALQKTVVNKNYEDASIFANKLLEVAKRTKNDLGIGKVYYEIGLIRRSKDEKNQALINYNQTRVYFEKTNYRTGLAKVLRNIGNLERELGNLEKGASDLLEAANHFNILQDTVSLSNTYNNIANIYNNLNDFEAAKKYYNKSISLKKLKDMTGIASTMNNVAYLYLENKKIDSAKIILIDALKIGKEKGNDAHIAHTYSGLGYVYFLKKDHETAKKYYDSVLGIGEKAQWKALMVDTEQQMGLIEMHLNNYKKADRFLSSARKQFIEIQETQLILKNYEFSAQLDSARGDYANALVWQKEYQKLSDKTAANNSIKKINLTKSRYEAELERLKLIDEQGKREQENKAALLRYKIIIYVVLSILLITTILLFTFVKNRKVRKKYISQLNESNEIKNKLFSIISHDLKNEISGLDASLSLMEENAFSPEEFEEIIPLLSNRTHQTSILLNNLLNWSKSQMKELNANPILFDITEVIVSKFSYFKPSADQKNIRLINKLAPTVIYADKDMFSIIAQNLIANAVKFCDSGDTVTLASEELDNHYKIYFIDTGVGIQDSKICKLFSEDTFTTLGTQNETGTGLGLKICKELTELNNGEIKVESIPGSGSTFSVSFPKAS